jgi:Cu-Zn family superoxide dismutase
MGAQHGGPTAEERHVGDLGNIEADENGNAKLDVVDSHLAFSGASSIIGRGVIVHEKADDMSTQPTGAAGSRLACGVIGVGSE